ncbi:hypothetical protein QOZ80_5AG0385230 [Eleusine coracana subsp. coracana]|nr:hypothetical protein QOZ80_5AG0385230 [Eleusine coracana subsp. coracana]
MMSSGCASEDDLALPELAGCDPLTQGYTLLPPVPDGLLASVLLQIQLENIEYFDAFFDPSGGYEEEHFRVMCWTRCPTMGALFIYSSISGCWTNGASISWHALGLEVQLLEVIVLPDLWPTYAYGCLYWKEVISNKLIELNINNMEFSIVNLPPDYENRDIAVVEAGEGRIGMVSLIHRAETLRYSIMQNETENANEHPVETTIPLPNEHDIYFIDGAAEGYIFLQGCHRDNTRRPAFFSLRIKTMKVEKVCSSNCVPYHLIPYFGFPPFMSPRRM